MHVSSLACNSNCHALQNQYTGAFHLAADDKNLGRILLWQKSKYIFETKINHLTCNKMFLEEEWFVLNNQKSQTNGCNFADDIFKCIFLNEKVWIPIKISLKFVPKGPINNIPAMVRVMAWRRPSDKSLSEPMMVSLPTHICVARPQWVNYTVMWHARDTTGNKNDFSIVCAGYKQRNCHSYKRNRTNTTRV